VAVSKYTREGQLKIPELLEIEEDEDRFVAVKMPAKQRVKLRKMATIRNLPMYVLIGEWMRLYS
jgi:hypothetical protein